MNNSKIYKLYSDGNCRLDVFISQNIDNITRSAAKKLIEGGFVKVDKKIQTDCKTPKQNAVIEVVYNQPNINAFAEDIPIEIIYQDDDLAIINKPQGMTVHAGSGTTSGTLVNALMHRFDSLSTINGEFRRGIVHRLDKDTSGILIIAKNDKAHLSLAQQIKNRTCKRYYLAITDNVIKDDIGVINTFIGRHPKVRTKMAVLESGRTATTNYKVLKRFTKNTLAEFELITGRTHQIRVHAAYINRPITGDKVYGVAQKNLKGQLLHAYKLKFTHPTSQKLMTFISPLPQEFLSYLKMLK